MSFKQGIILGVVFLIIALAGSVGVSYGVAQVVGVEGPAGEQGPRGESGPQGLTGAAGSSGSSNDLRDVQIGLRVLAGFWASQQTGESTGHPQTLACVDYILELTGSASDCGFSLVE